MNNLTKVLFPGNLREVSTARIPSHITPKRILEVQIDAEILLKKKKKTVLQTVGIRYLMTENERKPG